MVAPHAGAWIETMSYQQIVVLSEVAPHAGAWIETSILGSIFGKKRSHPMRVRGLKLKTAVSWNVTEVAPPAGAWIETSV